MLKSKIEESCSGEDADSSRPIATVASALRANASSFAIELLDFGEVRVIFVSVVLEASGCLSCKFEISAGLPGFL